MNTTVQEDLRLLFSIKLIKKRLFQKIIFQINAVLLNFLFKESWKIHGFLKNMKH